MSTIRLQPHCALGANCWCAQTAKLHYIFTANRRIFHHQYKYAAPLSPARVARRHAQFTMRSSRDGGVFRTGVPTK